MTDLVADGWLIVADDLTGAADCAIAFGRRGRAAAVTWGPVTDASDRRLPVLAYDAASRGLSAGDAARRHAEVLARLGLRGRRLFKKIDSTLRGQPAAETAATLAHLAQSGPAFGLFAPAFPATGRTTLGGRILVQGRPLEQAEVWQRDHTYANADLADVLATAGIRTEKVALAQVRTSGLRGTLARLAAEGNVIAACDAETEHDLHLIAAASRDIAPAPFFIGSAGLAHALADLDAAGAVEPLQIPASACGTLIVVGSLAGASRNAARALQAGGTVKHFPVAPEMLLGQDDAVRTALAAGVATHLTQGGDALVEITMTDHPDMRLGTQLANALADALQAVSPAIGAFAATGGETAAALLARFGVNGIRLADEIEPGVSLGLTLGQIAVPIATKAGAFGDAHSLIRISERLRTIRTRGSFS
ncbi:four-carbon acid sugar kinase family protein [Bradyrhizobium oligotrophicum]|uniref:four-carbon acid sugar kinase family protein n=1 Tax=Bradyrhizobium oligotrophicum TaxID=44255 RepID=UPI003EC0B317